MLLPSCSKGGAMELKDFDAHRSTVTTPDGEIAYVDIGEGPPALLIHGVFLNGALWRNVIETARHERRCIALDLPGHGRTKVRPDFEYSVASLTDVVERF